MRRSTPGRYVFASRQAEGTVGGFRLILSEIDPTASITLVYLETENIEKPDPSATKVASISV